MRKYLFADESGCLAFKRPHGSRYFILVTVSIADCSIGEQLFRLRRELAWDGLGDDSSFHASEDVQAVRDRIFPLVAGMPIRVDATILEKSKAMPHIRHTDAYFYQNAWFYHLKYLAPRILQAGDEVLVAAASIGQKKARHAFRAAINNVVKQVAPHTTWRTSFWAAESDPCLQIADYCAWAIQRKWERNDARSYDLIRDKIVSEYDLWRLGATHYY